MADAKTPQGASVTTAANQQPTISIVIPAYNEARRIGESCRTVNDYVRNLPFSGEVIVVDDGSTDETAEIVKRFEPTGLRLIRNSRNRGKGHSVRQGVFEAKGVYVLFTDADLSAPIEEMDRLLQVAQNGADIVIGSRAIDRSYIQEHQSLFREACGIVFNRIVRLLLGLRIHDTQCGFKLFHRARCRPVFEKLTTSGFGFDPEVLFLARRHGLRIEEVPVRWSHSEGSKVRLLRDGTRMLRDLLRIRWNSITGRYS